MTKSWLGETLMTTFLPKEVAEEALRLAAQKLPVRTKTVVRPDYVEES